MSAASAIDGPKGIGVFRPRPFNRNTIMPTIEPINAAKNNVKSVWTVPRTKPMTKKSLISPPPIPPFDTMPISKEVQIR